MPTGCSGIEEIFPSLPAPPEVFAQSPSHKQTFIYHLNHQTWWFDFYIMDLSNTSGFLHRLSESQAALPEHSSRLRHEWMFSTFPLLRWCCLLTGDGDEQPNSKAVVDQDGRRREHARWMVNAAKRCLLFLPAVFHCCCQRLSFVFEVEGCGGDGNLASALMALAAVPWAL